MFNLNAVSGLEQMSLWYTAMGEEKYKNLNCHSSELLSSEGAEGAEHLISLSSAF